ncbi:ABC transporter permease [Aestuariispira insulae]|uniref:Putative spermidine/putrescine transport system permease protein n=1 Tax=Aestuariispira insulae TaxID=1461337 RepID=A0A3D9HSB7_9PROT|nr:ABC transporter permease [Aestuariispira insulae]RED52398.1 putative spermidine/putrescine transport system permease protein [Aestuariispira insulae]
MANVADTMPDPMTGEDGIPLKTKLRIAERRNRIKAALLVLPLFAFILVTFLVPIGQMLYRSVENNIIADNLPRTIELLSEWDGNNLPPEPVFETMVAELKIARETKEIGKIGKRLNYEMSGMLSLFKKSGRKVRKLETGPYKEALIKIDKDWGDPEVWATIKQVSDRITGSYYLAAVDLKRSPQGEIVAQPDYKQIYVSLFIKTLWISLLVTMTCILLGFPVSFLLSNLPMRTSNLLMILVLLPFWTSLLVRTTSWIALLQSEGMINDLLVTIGFIGDDERLKMMFNQTGTIIAMTHILLPFMILPLYSVMKTISPSYVRAARSLGANPFTAFWRIYFPQTLPGIGAGSILVFILSIGYYITPALVGGQDGQLISNLIAYHMQSSLNWGLAAALGSILLAGVLVLYMIYNKIVGIDNMKLG